MNFEFDLGKVSVTEFGVGRGDGESRNFVRVPVDFGVQAVLRTMVHATRDAMQKGKDRPARYSPSEKHGSKEYLYVPLDDDLAVSVRELHDAVNLDISSRALLNPGDISCYFAHFTDRRGRRLTALRRAAQFKGVVKSKNRLVRMLDDTLRIIEDTVFKLDSEFDLLADDENVHILRPIGFEFVGGLNQAILDAVPENIDAIRQAIPFVDFSEIEAYAREHPRAARYIASIRSQKNRGIDKSLLMRLCTETGVKFSKSKRQLRISAGHEMGFLEVLDRRRFEVTLVREEPEKYRAASRSKIDG